MSNNPAGNATIQQLQWEVLLNPKGQYMKESNTFGYNVTIKQLQRGILLNKKGQYIEE